MFINIKMAQFYCVHMKQYYTTFKNVNESYVRGFEELVKVTKNVPNRIPFIYSFKQAQECNHKR